MSAIDPRWIDLVHRSIRIENEMTELEGQMLAKIPNLGERAEMFVTLRDAVTHYRAHVRMADIRERAKSREGQ